MAQFRKKPVVVEAVQVLWSTWTELCAWLGPGSNTVGCYVDKDGKETEDTNGRIGVKRGGRPARRRG